MLGIGSGVATFALSLARQAGARVLVTSSSAEKLERARELGADAGVDYTAGDWAAEVRALTGGEGVDVVVDSVGATWPDSLRCLRTGGRLAVFGATAGERSTLEVRPFYFGQFSLLGTTMGSPRDFSGLLEAVERGSWAPAIDSVRPLAEIAAAHERLERGEQFGKLVLSVGRTARRGTATCGGSAQPFCGRDSTALARRDLPERSTEVGDELSKDGWDCLARVRRHLV